jgi:hypothetical protein
MNNFRAILFLFSIFPGLIQGQSLRGLQQNPVIKRNLPNTELNLKSASASAQLYLPFYEDFSTSSVVPDPAKWTDQHVFINNTFSLDPPSVGVATFDAIDRYGNVYAVKGIPVSSDTLTSVDFDLSVYQGTPENVRLSFFYQCGGRGEVPEFNDSLVLEFYSPSDTLWSKVWYVTLDEPSDFIQQIIEVQPDYFVNGFRFRFRNYTSLSTEEVSGGEGALSNADCWNLDYILMNTESEYYHVTINNDITITDIPRNVLDLYETIPWTHMNTAINTGITRNNITYGIRNYMPQGDSSNIGRSYYVRNYNSGAFLDYEPPWDEQLPNGVLVFRELPLIANFSRSDNLSEGRIEIASYLRTLDFGPKENDTSKVLLHFTDTYVYDDGSPEYGFGIEGPSMTGALLALRFRIFEPDTLTGVEMFFNRAYNDYNATLPFQLCVWKDGGGKPGDLLYMSEEFYYPDFSTVIPGLNRYVVPGDFILTDSIIYLGWKQQTDAFLNLGYDVNNNNLSRTFVNTGGNWISPGGSLLPGTIMIRAVFGNTGVITTSVEPFDVDNEVTIYPNPVSSVLQINSGIPIDRMHLVDMSGRIVYQQTGNIKTIDVSLLSPGIYQVILICGSNKPVIRKIVVSR